MGLTYREHCICLDMQLVVYTRLPYISLRFPRLPIYVVQEVFVTSRRLGFTGPEGGTYDMKLLRPNRLNFPSL